MCLSNDREGYLGDGSKKGSEIEKSAGASGKVRFFYEVCEPKKKAAKWIGACREFGIFAGFLEKNGLEKP